MKENKIDYTKISNIVIDGIDTRDYPDFCDAYISSADYDDEPMTDEMLELLNQDSSYVYDCVINQIF